MTAIPIEYSLAKLWPILFPIITYGDRFDVMHVYKELKQFPIDEPIIELLNTCAIKRLAEFGIDHNFVY
jgi:hypothetical protein